MPGRPTRHSLPNRRRSPSFMPIWPSRLSSRSRVLLPGRRRLADFGLAESKSPAVLAGLFYSAGRRGDYLATRSFDSELPIEVKAATVWLADVIRKKFSGELAQFCSRVDVGSGSVVLVFTWMV